MKSTVTRDTDLNVNTSSQHEEAGGFYQDMILLHAISRIYEFIFAFLLTKHASREFITMQQGIRIHANRFIYKEGGKAPISNMLLEEILRIFPKDSEMNVEPLIFIQSLSFLSQENSLISKMPTHLMNLIKKADEFLLQISSELELPMKHTTL